MFFLYSLLLFVALVAYSPVYYVKLRLIKGESLHLKKRLGIGIQKWDRKGKSLWIHAVSVGEVLSLRNLVSKLREMHPDWFIRISTLTQTGFHIAREKLAGVDDVVFVPLDFKCIVRRFFKAFEPDLFILAESEFWPNLLRVAKRWSRGMLLINGRISPRSGARYRKYRFFVTRILRYIDFFLVQTERDKEMLERLDISSSRISVSGNLKADIVLPRYTETELESLRREWNIAGKHHVVVAGSTHRGEEEKLLAAFVEAKVQRQDIRLILAPRHMGRADEVLLLCAQYGLKAIRRTSGNPGTSWEVLVLDTLGELAQFYAISDVSFVGGSLVPRGGQNLLEPAFYGKPVYFGPHMDNFAFFAQKFIEAEGACAVGSHKDLVQMFLVKEREALLKMGSRAGSALNSLRGATEMTIAKIESSMED